LNNKQIIVNNDDIYKKNQKTIILYAVDTEKSKNTEVSIPFEWIIKIENIDDSPSDSILHSDILLEIDNM
jgi:hypothetical protein